MLAKFLSVIRNVHNQQCAIKLVKNENFWSSYRSMTRCLYLFFGSNGFSGGNYHYRVLVHIPILDHRFLRDYLTRNEPKLHVFNLLNWEKKVQRKTDLRIVKMRLAQNGKYFR